MQLILLLVLAGAAVLLYRRFVADAEKLQKKSQQEVRERQTGANGTLIKDPETGEYRVRRDDE